MAKAEVTCRFIQEIGTTAKLRVFWGDKDCPNCVGGGHPGYHNATVPLMVSDDIADWKLGGQPEDYPDDRWPTACDHCGAAVPPELADLNELDRSDQVERQVFRKRRYNTESGSPEIGDMYWHDWMHDEAEKREDGSYPCFNWTNCMGPHLYVVLPDGHEWDVDGRASNCTLKDDKTHRCWVWEGEPPNVTAGKTGHTCSAGAGSIATGKWHGFLRGGKLIG